MVKKWLTLFLAACMLSSSAVNAAEPKAEAYAQRRVCGLGIMEGDENGEFHFDAFITRAEFVAVALRLRLYGKAGQHNEETRFSDVPVSHWASGLIAMADSMGLVTGDAENTFRPDEYVTYDETVKILVSAAGYDVMAEELGGYPEGYYAAGTRLGITYDTERFAGNVTRGEVCGMINNTLDVVPLEKSTGRDEYAKNAEGFTLYERYSVAQELSEVKGVLLETGTVSAVSGNISIEENQVQIGDAVYECSADYSGLLGYYVEGWTRQSKTTGRYEIAALSIADDNKSWEAEPEIVELRPDNIVVYSDVSRKTSKKYFYDSSLICVYNGRRTAAPKRIYSGSYRGIDNDADGRIELLIMEERASFIVSRVNEEVGMLYFEGRQTYHGKNGVRVSRDEPEYLCRIFDSDGNSVDYTKIQPGSAISVAASENDEYIRILTSEQTIDGKIDGVFDDYITVDGEKHTPAKAQDGNFTLYQYLDSGTELLGISGPFAVDAYGGIVGPCDSVEQDTEVFGYAVQAVVEDGFSETVRIRLLQGMTPVKEVKKISGNEKIYYNFQNDILREFCGADKMKLNGKAFEREAIQDIAGRIVKLRLNTDGEIKEITAYEVPDVLDKCDFNGEILSFGGQGLQRGYATDKNTMFICIPKFYDEEEDYYVRVQLADESTANEVFGVNAYHRVYSSALPDSEIRRREEAEPVEVLLISAYMDASQTTIVPDTADICMVGSIASKLGELRGDEDSIVYSIELLNDKERRTVDTKSSGSAFETAKKRLKPGDLIRYTTDAYGRIEQLDILASVQGLESYGEKEKGYYGIIEDLQQDFYDFQVNQMIDEITVYFDDYQQRQIVRLLKENGQPVYLYDRKKGTISTATTDGIATISQTDKEEATRVFVLMEDNDAQAVVLIEN